MKEIPVGKGGGELGSGGWRREARGGGERLLPHHFGPIIQPRPLLATRSQIPHTAGTKQTVKRNEDAIIQGRGETVVSRRSPHCYKVENFKNWLYLCMI